MTDTSTPSCPKCGQAVDSDSSFCKQCGFDLKRASSIDEASAQQTKMGRILVISFAGVALLVIIIVALVNKSGDVVSLNTSASAPQTQTAESQSVPAAPKNNLPPDNLITSQVTNIVKRSVTNNNFGYKTTSVSVGLVEIVRRGEFHPSERFFVVQVRTKGQKDEKYDATAYGGLSCGYNGTFCERTCEFDATNEFRIYRNDYGDWLSDIAVPWQFRIPESCGEKLTE